MTEKEYKRQWYLKNAELCKARAKANRLKDPEYKAKKRAYYLKNREHLKLKSVKRRKDNNELVRASDRKTYVKHREKRLALMREYAISNPGVNVKASANYRKNHPEKRKLIAIKCAAKRRVQKLKTSVEDINFQLLLKNANGFCEICFIALDEKWHFDHIVPLSKGGSHTQANLQVVHPRCNLKKSAKLDYQHV